MAKKSQISNLKSQIEDNTSQSSHASKASSMAELMEKIATAQPGAKTTFVTPKKGELLTGVVTKLTTAEVLIDINAKTEAVVLEKDKKLLRAILAILKLGDQVTVSVLNPESDLGNTVVSLRRFMDEKLWVKLEAAQKSQEPLDGTISDITRGGFLVDTRLGVSGFLPNSQTSFAPEEGDPSDAIGRQIKIYVLELNKQARKIIFSQKPVMGMQDFDNAIKKLYTGKKITVTVSNITNFGAFAQVPVDGGKPLDGLIHISEISWDKVEDIGALYNSGQQVEVVVIGFDREGKRVDLSVKRLTQDPFDKLGKEFAVDQKVVGKVTRIGPVGVSLELSTLSGESVEGFIRREKIPPTVSYELGDSVNATVSQVDTRKHRIVLVPVLLRKTVGYR